MQNKNVKIALEGSITKSLIVMSVPILIGNLLQSAYQLIDAFWVGKLGANAVAAVSVSFPITFFLIALGTGFAVAGSTLIAQYVGAKNQPMVNHVAAQTLLMVILISAFLGCVGYALAPTLLHLMNVEIEVYAGALSFMRVSFLSLVFVFGFVMFQSIMRGIGQVKSPTYIVFGTVLLNFLLDPFFIYGYGVVPAMGVSGAAIATFATQTLALVIGLYILFSGRQGIYVKLRDFIPDIDLIKRVFFLGVPSSIEMSARAFALIILTFLLTSFGTEAVATYGAGSNILQVVMIPALGLSMATSVLVGQNIGAKNFQRAEKIAHTSFKTAFASLTIIGILVFILAPYLVGFFIPGDQTIISGGTKFLRTISLSFGFMGLAMSVNGVLRASGNMKTTMILTMISQFVFQIPLAYILSKHTSGGIDALWYAFPLSNIFTAILSFVWFKTGKWKSARITEDVKVKEEIMEEGLYEKGSLR